MVHLHFLHGFLGLPSDWGPLMINMKAEIFNDWGLQPQLHMHNLWKDLQALPDPSLKNWGLKFAQKLPPSGNVLIGYSMGGRLAMHFPVWEQQKILGMILISAHPGLGSEIDRKARLQDDFAWSEKFLRLPWDQVTEEWNRQPIFGVDRLRPKRKESDFSRELLAKSLNVWSLGQQEPMIDRLKEFRFPIYYFHGSEDEKFAVLARSIKTNVPSVHVYSVPGAHSPHFSAAQDITVRLKSFFNGLRSEKVK